MTEAGYTTMTELVREENEYEAILYNDLSDLVRNRRVRIVHIISVPKTFVFSAKTGPEYLRMKTGYFMIDDSYAKVDSRLHVVVGTEVFEAIRGVTNQRIHT